MGLIHLKTLNNDFEYPEDLEICNKHKHLALQFHSTWMTLGCPEIPSEIHEYIKKWAKYIHPLTYDEHAKGLYRRD